jgi:4-hydroxy-tetrahydrodipicolinate reductase
MMATTPIRIGVCGALGRMGRAVASVARNQPGARLGPLADRPGLAGQTVEGAALLTPAQVIAASDVIIDFSTPAASVALAQACAAQAAASGAAPALVIGATGFSPEEAETLDQTAGAVAVVRSGNFSLGVNVLIGLVEQASRILQARDWDIEVFEAHHKRKIDAPSGTALMLGEAAARGRQVELDAVALRGRDGVTGARPEGGIGFAVSRGGGVIGEHSVSFAAEEEIITLAHSARDRGLFARGAVAAALWVAGKPPGLYDMMDVLGFKDRP